MRGRCEGGATISWLMDALLWSSRFVTGLELVDEQHHRLVDLINTFGELCANHATVAREQLEAVVAELAAYAATHFADEERLMAEQRLDPRFLTMHQRLHGQFLRDVQQMRAAGFIDTPETARSLLKFLLHWLAFHILGSDMQAARQIERVQRGESPASAFAAEVHEVTGPAELLMGALDDLMRVIAVRNAELVEANRTLEARVVERTAALQSANEQLTHTLDALKATQSQLVDSAKLASIGQLASGVAHELNNPLGFVSANLATLEESCNGLIEFVKAVDAAVPAAVATKLQETRERLDLDELAADLPLLLHESKAGLARVAKIIGDLKEFSRVDAPGVDVDLKSSVEVTLNVSAAQRQGAKVVTELQPTGRVHCDATLVNQSILALITNAALAVNERGSGAITVRTGVDGAGGFVEVEDSGVGMTAEVLGRATEPFFTTRPPGQGVGLGLTTVHNCARAHEGRFELSSTRGEGTVARLWLPLACAAVVTGSLRNEFYTRRYG